MTTMPDPKTDLTDCLAALAAEHGAEWTFALIGAIRDHRGAGEAGVVRARLARHMVDEQMRASGDNDETAAIRAVGERLGYTPFTRQGGKVINTLDNFKKLVRGTTRTGMPIGDGS